MGNRLPGTSLDSVVVSRLRRSTQSPTTSPDCQGGKPSAKACARRGKSVREKGGRERRDLGCEDHAKHTTSTHSRAKVGTTSSVRDRVYIRVCVFVTDSRWTSFPRPVRGSSGVKNSAPCGAHVYRLIGWMVCIICEHVCVRV